MALSKEAQIIRVLGIGHLILALIITALGVTITVKFKDIHHEGYYFEHALRYEENPWTTTYGAGIFVGLLILFSGIMGSFFEIKPEKECLAYTCIILNVLITIVSLSMVIFSGIAIAWYKTCQYWYIDGAGRLVLRECSKKDKTEGKTLYESLLAVLLLEVLLAMATTLYHVRINDLICGPGCWVRVLFKLRIRSGKMISFENAQSFDHVLVANPTEANAAVRIEAS